MRTGDIIATTVRAFLERGGTIAKIPEGKTTVDWSDSRLRNLARHAAACAHKKRYRKKARRA